MAHVPPQEPPKSPHMIETFLSTSSSSSSSSSSGPSPPSSDTSSSPESSPSPPNALPDIQHAPHSGNVPKRTPRRYRKPTTRLGAIDEDSSSISPDVPLRNPRRLLNNMTGAHTKLFNFAFAPTPRLAPPPNPYEGLVGPNGEKFGDLRQNRSDPARRGGNWKRLVCLGCLILIIGAAVAIGVIVGLNRKNAANNKPTPVAGPAPNTNASFPLGTFGITTYLTTIATNCTSNPATWRCYPYQTYNQSAHLSTTTIDWIIDSANTNPNNASRFIISSSDPTFSYPFANVSLHLEDENTADEAYTFTYSFRKTVIPNAALTSDGLASRCYYNNTILSARLYTRKERAAQLLTDATGDNSTMPAGTGMEWPFALEYEENISTAPDCYAYTNGQDGDHVDLAAVTSPGDPCECNYMNYGV